MTKRYGWFKLSRKIFDNAIINKDMEHFYLWIYLLSEAEYEPREDYYNGQLIEIKVGQLATGRKQLSLKTGVSESKIERILNRFEIEHLIEQQKCTKNRLISIVNYEKYQISEQHNEQPLNNKRTTTEQPLNTRKEYKNIRSKEKDKDYKDFSWFVTEHLEFKSVLDEYSSMRKSIKKKMTPKAEELFINKLQKLIDKGYNGIELIENAIMNNWLSIYEPTNKKTVREDVIPEHHLQSYVEPSKSAEIDRSEIIRKIKGN